MTTFALEQFGLQEVKRNWGWYLALGIALVILGVTAMGSAVALTKVSVVFFGWLLIVAGVAQSVHAF